MPDKKILVIGDAMLDTYHFGKVDRISPEAPVPVFLETGRKKHVPGGAANVAVNIAAIGVPVDLCAVVGKDEAANKLKALLTSQNVDIRMICESQGRRTTNKLRYIGPNNQQILRVDEEDASDIPFEEIADIFDNISAQIEQYGLFLISDYQKGLLTDEIAQAFIRMANGHRIPVLADVKGSRISKYRNATLLKPNRKELSDLTGMGTDSREMVIAAAESLCEAAACRYVLTTLGAEGMLLVERGQVAKEVKSVAKEVYDVTGAGDTSIAYLAAELVLGKDIMEAMEISNHAAGLQVSRVGTSIIYPEEVAQAMDRQGSCGKDKWLDFYQEDGLRRLKEKQRNGCKVVFSNGCFDILHAGHVAYLEEARKMGDLLVIGVNTDASVKRLKGSRRPINPLADRMTLLAALEAVDFVVPFQEDTPLELIKKIGPDVLVKGGDYRVEEIVGAKEVLANGGEVRVLPFLEGRSTTNMIEKMQNS
ncbi:MAG TPA: D-glycero-beta-D-manno-heptose 1-phosphate adenylyltransferase [Lachnospiraceae bacterium]|nr:D-glycero-beta-D-manno-heptose 1-phosphate adenylyltransferase [Lachnospiraceae bacterium]